MAPAVVRRRLELFQPVYSLGHLTPNARLFCGSYTSREVRQYRCLSVRARIRSPRRRRLNGCERLRTWDVAVDNYAVRFQHAPFLARDLRLDALVIATTRVRLAELGRSEESAVLHAVE